MRSHAVRAHLQIAPWWVWSLITWFLFAGLMTILGWIDFPRSEHRLRLVVIELVVGVIVGALTGPMAARRERKIAAVAGDLSNDDLVVARRAARRGPCRRIGSSGSRPCDSPATSSPTGRCIAGWG